MSINPTEKIFTDGSSYFTAMISAIADAKESIDLETYIFNDDSLGKAIADALILAAKREVD